MRIHLGRAALAAVVLAELGAITGALLCWLFFAGWAFLSYGPLDRNALLSIALWAMMVGLPLGAVAAPALGFSVLRRTPLGRALGFPIAGALLGLATAAVFSPGPALLPLSALVPALAAGGLALGAVIARVGGRVLTSGTKRLQP
jgi:hypothetical protein